MATGADQGFQVRKGELKKIVPSGGRHENFGIFRVKIHDFTPKNLIFSNFRGACTRCALLDPPLGKNKLIFNEMMMVSSLY